MTPYNLPIKILSKKLAEQVSAYIVLCYAMFATTLVNWNGLQRFPTPQ